MEVALAAGAKTVPAPQTEAEARALMSVTYDQHILPPGAKPETLEQLLEIGEVIFYYDHPVKIPWMSAAGMLIQAPVELVYEVILDQKHYPEFVPMNEGIDSRKLFDAFYAEDLHINIKMAFVSYKMDYGLYSIRRPPTRLDWSLAWGDFDINVGFWELVPTPDHKRTMAFYSIYSVPSSAFVKKIYRRESSLEMLTNVSTATMIVQAIRKESEKRAGFKRTASAIQPMAGIQKILEADPASLLAFLSRGNMVILADGPTVYAVVGSMVQVPAAGVYKVITDFTRYPEFVSGVKKVEPVGAAQGNCFKWELESDLFFLKYSQVQQYYYQYSPPAFVWWETPRPCCGPAPGFWKVMTVGDQTIFFNGSTADLRSLGMIPKYALSVEPTLEYAALASQGVLLINAIKARIEKK